MKLAIAMRRSGLFLFAMLRGKRRGTFQRLAHYRCSVRRSSARQASQSGSRPLTLARATTAAGADAGGGCHCWLTGVATGAGALIVLHPSRRRARDRRAGPEHHSYGRCRLYPSSAGQERFRALSPTRRRRSMCRRRAARMAARGSRTSDRGVTKPASTADTCRSQRRRAVFAHLLHRSLTGVSDHAFISHRTCRHRHDLRRRHHSRGRRALSLTQSQCFSVSCAPDHRPCHRRQQDAPCDHDPSDPSRPHPKRRDPSRHGPYARIDAERDTGLYFGVSLGLVLRTARKQ